MVSSERTPVSPFLALEGCDGVGKSSIRDVLRRGLEGAGWACVMVGQHSWLNPRVARVINDVRDRRRSYSANEIADAYFMDKSLHASETILPALCRAAVIADRYVISDAVYQEVLYGIPAERTLDRHRRAATLMPTLIVFIDVATEEAYRRILRRHAEKTRHYERPAELGAIRQVYDRVLLRSPPAWMPPVVQFVNDLPNWPERVERELFPTVVDALAAKGTNEPA